MEKTDSLFFLSMIIFWGLNYPLVKIGFRYENPYVLLFYRLIFAAIGTLIIFNRHLVFRFSRRSFQKLIVLSLFNILIFMELWFIGEQYISASLTSIIIYTYPITSTLLSIIFLKEKYRKESILGIILGFAGIFVVFYNGIDVQYVYGILIALGGSISWAIGTIFYKKYIITEDKASVNFYQILLAIAPSFIIAYISDPGTLIFTPPPIFIIITILMGVPGTALAYYAYLHLYRKLNVSVVSSFLFLVPVSSVIFAYFLLNESLSYLQYSGLVLIGIGIYFSSLGSRK
ncbi:DMT family transporter [Caldiplasma sukawensis]